MAGQSTDNAARVCTDCGTPADTDYVYCKRCGSRLATAQSGPSSPALCTHCGSAVTSGAMFCAHCGTGLGATPSSGGPTTSWPVVLPSRPKKPPKSTARQVATAVAVLVVVLLLLMLVPLPLPYQDQFQTWAFQPAYSPLGLPNSVSVSGSWSTNGGGSVAFAIVDLHGKTVYAATGSSGSFSLNWSGQPYAVAAYALFPTTVTVSGTSWSPLINVGLP